MPFDFDPAELRSSVTVLDGAWGTELQARGLPPGEPPDCWNLEQPEAVREVAAAYARAGSRIVLTNTFGANRIALARHDMAEGVDALNEAGARLSREAVGEVTVFGSMGPTGALLLTGEIDAAEVERAFREQALALQRGGVQGLVVETMLDLEEAEIAVRCAAATGLPVVASLAYGAGADGAATVMGATPEQAVERLIPAGADVIGANCGTGIDACAAAVARYRAAWDGPLWAKPNAGTPELVEGRAVYSASPSQFAEGMLRVVRAGADLVGGCCGTTPAFITALAQSLSS